MTHNTTTLDGTRVRHDNDKPERNSEKWCSLPRMWRGNGLRGMLVMSRGGTVVGLHVRGMRWQRPVDPVSRSRAPLPLDSWPTNEWAKLLGCIGRAMQQPVPLQVGRIAGLQRATRLREIRRRAGWDDAAECWKQ